MQLAAPAQLHDDLYLIIRLKHVHKLSHLEAVNQNGKDNSCQQTVMPGGAMHRSVLDKTFAAIVLIACCLCLLNDMG